MAALARAKLAYGEGKPEYEYSFHVDANKNVKIALPGLIGMYR